MANEKTLNDLSLKLQETNLRLEILADSGNKQETHLATLVKASKGDKLQDAEDNVRQINLIALLTQKPLTRLLNQVRVDLY